MRHRLGQLAFLLLFGFSCAVMGARIENGEEPQPPAAVTAPPRVVVHKETVKVPTLPESCRRALDMAIQARKAAGDYDTTTGKQLDVMDDAVKAMFEKDYKALNDLITRQRAIRDATVPASDTLHRELSGFTYVLGKCNSDLGG
jgi:hypothetical protein